MNSDMLLNRIRMAQQGLIGVHKKLYTLEHLLPSPDPAQFAETAKSAALLSERSTASLRGFLFTTTGGMPEARVIAVADKSIRVEIFGVECSIMARDLAWDWIGDAHDRFAVGDQILVRMTEVNKTPQEELSVHADIKSVTENTSREALKRCRVQSKYAGRVTDVHKGIVYVRLSNGVNAVAHSCYDRRTPGKKDDVSFVVTKLDEERSIAVGIITRIIRQNL